jgi:hypothetical protein
MTMDQIQMTIGGKMADFGLWLYWNAKRRKLAKRLASKEGYGG